jgi:hypothetical protein
MYWFAHLRRGVGRVVVAVLVFFLGLCHRPTPSALCHLAPMMLMPQPSSMS